MVAVSDAQLAPRAVAIGVHRGLRHAQFAGNLLGAEMLMDEAQAITLALGQQLDRGHLAVSFRPHLNRE